MSLTGRVFFLSPRPLLKKEKTRDRMLSYLTLYLGIVPCLQGLSRFSKHIGGGKEFFGTHSGKETILQCHRNTRITSAGHFRTPHPLEFPSQGY